MKLKHYQPQFKQDIEDFQVTREQLLFVRFPQDNIPLSEKVPSRKPILGFNNDGDCVVFFVLQEHSEFEKDFDLPNSIYVRSFVTDKRHLHRGYAKSALLALPQFLKKEFPHIDYITLLVDHPNTIAKEMYHKCGFTEGKLIDGERYPAYTMIKAVK